MNSSRPTKTHSRSITNAPLRWVSVRSISGKTTNGRIIAGNLRFLCALGKGGTTRKKREGDGATPLGDFRLRRLWYRPDKGMRPLSRLPIKPIRPDDGWCDAPVHRRYNRPVKLPFPVSHEKMWRQDHLYNVVIEIGWNDAPCVPGLGSAIFFHLARDGYKPTEGCVAITKNDMRKLLPRLGPQTRMLIR